MSKSKTPKTQKQKKPSRGSILEGFRRRGMKSTIMWKLVLITLISLVTVSGAMVSTFLGYFEGLTVDNAEKQLQNDTNLASETLTQWISLTKAQIEHEATLRTLFLSSIPYETRKQQLIDDAVGTEYDDFSISNNIGHTYNNTEIADREYFIHAMAGETYMSDPIVRRTDNSLTFMVGTPITASGFENSGIVYGAVSINFLSRLLSALDLGESGYGFLLDKNGSFIAHPNEDNIRNQVNLIELAKTDAGYSEISAIAERMIKGETFTARFTMPDGAAYVGSFTPVSGSNGWSLGIIQSQDELMSNINSTKKTIVRNTLTLIFLVLFVNIIFASRIVNPVRAISNELDAFSNGELDRDLSVIKASKDETGKLLQSLVQTQKELQVCIGDVSEILQNITDGNLDCAVDKDYKGDFVQIKNSLNEILNALNSTFAEINNASSALLIGADQIMNASQSLASASTEQASAVVQITAAIEGIASSSDKNTEDVLRVNDLTQNVKGKAALGNEQMHHMLQAMSEINEASNNIAKIMKVIDNIAFQTNILSLNASVEAARAGVHGQGFAVVADEVRALANKSADAAAEIAEMIENSIAKISIGTQIASETATELENIVSGIDEVADIMTNIAEVTKSQAESITQVSNGISQISNAVQSNSATSEECAASSVELSEQARLLADRINFYKLRG